MPGFRWNICSDGICIPPLRGKKEELRPNYTYSRNGKLKYTEKLHFKNIFISNNGSI